MEKRRRRLPTHLSQPWPPLPDTACAHLCLHGAGWDRNSNISFERQPPTATTYHHHLLAAWLGRQEEKLASGAACMRRWSGTFIVCHGLSQFCGISLPCLPATAHLCLPMGGGIPPLLSLGKTKIPSDIHGWDFGVGFLPCCISSMTCQKNKPSNIT